MVLVSLVLEVDSIFESANSYQTMVKAQYHGSPAGSLFISKGIPNANLFICLSVRLFFRSLLQHLLRHQNSFGSWSFKDSTFVSHTWRPSLLPNKVMEGQMQYVMVDWEDSLRYPKYKCLRWQKIDQRAVRRLGSPGRDLHHCRFLR